MKTIPTLLCDFYKISHRIQYPANTQEIYSNFTARNDKLYKGKESKFYDSDYMFFGITYVVKKLHDLFNEHFFNKNLDDVVNDYTRVLKYCLNDITFPQHIIDLYRLGYLPLQIKSLPEKSIVQFGIPVITVKNTLPDFFWLTNFIETFLSSELWLICNSASLSYEYKKICNCYAYKTCTNNDHVKFQCHDFSFRGMSGVESAMISGMGHLANFNGTDTIPAILGMEYYYNKNIENELIGCSIPASEHSVMSAGGKDTELETYRRFITKLYPNGLVSIVSDTWDFWAVLTDILPQLKNEIMARDGKVVIRPDSGNPADIICGNNNIYSTLNEQKGAIEILWDTFGGTINEKGYKVLDSHIGLIYGDSITLERCQDILERLEQKGFASSNVVFGIGSYTYQYNTRDSMSFAMKSTNAVINNQSIAIYKEPKTDINKKSAKGYLRVELENDEFVLYDNQSAEQEQLGMLKTIYLNGETK